MKLIGRKIQRKLRRGDFRKQTWKQYSDIILVAGDGWIDLSIIRKRFPDEQDRNRYINGLIEGFGEDLRRRSSIGRALVL